MRGGRGVTDPHGNHKKHLVYIGICLNIYYVAYVFLYAAYCTYVVNTRNKHSSNYIDLRIEIRLQNLQPAILSQASESKV